jgi:RNA polymerase sigma-70 factor (ECF subfamily)
VENRRWWSEDGSLPEIHPRQKPLLDPPDLTPEQQAESSRSFAALPQACPQALRALADLLARTADADLFDATEFQARDRLLPSAAQALETALARRKKRYDGSSRACPHCGEAAKFQRWQAKALVSLVGSLRLERARHRQVTGCVRGNVHRMDYPRYQANGWLMGSGHVAAACKAVIGQRLKGSGRRWSEVGAAAVCQLRVVQKRKGPMGRLLGHRGLKTYRLKRRLPGAFVAMGRSRGPSGTYPGARAQKKGKNPLPPFRRPGSNNGRISRISKRGGAEMAGATPPSDTGHSGDGELIARFRAGDGHALEALLERYEAPLFQFLVGILQDHHQAEDALQETWCRALTHLDGVDWGHLRGWLFTVAYHQAMLARRRQKGKPVAAGKEPLPDPGPGPLAEAARQEELRRLRLLLERLPEGQREVIRQRVYEGKKFREIADALDCPLNTALARMHEGLKRLRVLWGTEHG